MCEPPRAALPGEPERVAIEKLGRCAVRLIAPSERPELGAVGLHEDVAHRAIAQVEVDLDAFAFRKADRPKPACGVVLEALLCAPHRVASGDEPRPLPGVRHLGGGEPVSPRRRAHRPAGGVVRPPALHTVCLDAADSASDEVGLEADALPVAAAPVAAFDEASGRVVHELAVGACRPEDAEGTSVGAPLDPDLVDLSLHRAADAGRRRDAHRHDAPVRVELPLEDPGRLAGERIGGVDPAHEVPDRVVAALVDQAAIPVFSVVRVAGERPERAGMAVGSVVVEAQRRPDGRSHAAQATERVPREPGDLARAVCERDRSPPWIELGGRDRSERIRDAPDGAGQRRRAILGVTRVHDLDRVPRGGGDPDRLVVRPLESGDGAIRVDPTDDACTRPLEPPGAADARAGILEEPSLRVEGQTALRTEGIGDEGRAPVPRGLRVAEAGVVVAETDPRGLDQPSGLVVAVADALAVGRGELDEPIGVPCVAGAGEPGRHGHGIACARQSAEGVVVEAGLAAGTVGDAHHTTGRVSVDLEDRLTVVDPLALIDRRDPA